jgi:hypothetical protein
VGSQNAENAVQAQHARANRPAKAEIKTPHRRAVP